MSALGWGFLQLFTNIEETSLGRDGNVGLHWRVSYCVQVRLMRRGIYGNPIFAGAGGHLLRGGYGRLRGVGQHRSDSLMVARTCTVM